MFKVWQDLELSNVELEDSEQWEEEVMLCMYQSTCYTYVIVCISNKDPGWK